MPYFDLHALGWRAFQDLCSVILREVLGQTVQAFADSNDGGRDGAFFGKWVSPPSGAEDISGPFVVQCKFTALADKTLSLSDISDELAKIEPLVAQKICTSYILLTNARVTGTSEAAIRHAIMELGVAHVLILSGNWINQTIAINQRLRMFVPRVYGLGDLSQILDERAYAQAKSLLDYLQDDLSTFVVTEAYRNAAKAIEQHGFCLLLGEPAVGKSVVSAALAISALDNWNSLVIRAEGAEDVCQHWNPDEPNQFFWVDDAFGSVRHDMAFTDSWVRRLPKVMAAIAAGAKIILTSRDYIYREARGFLKEYAYPLLRENQVVIEVANLTRAERHQILYNHVRLGDQDTATRRALKPYLQTAADEQPFWPEVARRIGKRAFTQNLQINQQSVIDFMTHPNSYLGDIYQSLPADHVGALAMVYRSGGLAVPLDLSPGTRELLELVGATPDGVSRSLKVLEETFLRRGPKLGSADSQQYWTFRHPTLREGYAIHIARDPNLLRTFVQGLDDISIVNLLDCGSGETKGTLISIPPILYGYVAERLMEARPGFRRLLYEDYRTFRRAWHEMLASRSSKGFLEAYLTVDADFISRLTGFTSSMALSAEIPVLAKLNDYGMLPESARLKVVERIRENATETPDADWLDMRVVDRLIRSGERDSIIGSVREIMALELDWVLDAWTSNEQGESADEYYAPLDETLTRYAQLFEAEPLIYEKIRAALEEVDSVRSQARRWTTASDDTGSHPYEDPEWAASSDRYNMEYRRSGSGRRLWMRNVFEDVDQ